MRVCTTYGSDMPIRKGSEMHEIRLDVFDGIPDGVGDESLVTLCGKDISVIPKDFKGLVDVGDSLIKTEHRKIRSIHDFERTPSADEIVGMLSEGDQEISKGAFVASSFKDLKSILDASKRLDRKHVLLGMGKIGEVTRIRQRVLGNEFSFGYHGVSTAPGQLSADEMEELGDDCVLTGITGHPLSHTKSPAMQSAAMKAAGINGRYLTFDSPDLEGVEDVILGYDIRGINVTIPYKQEIMSHLDHISGAAVSAGAVNTIVNDNGKLIGHNTDVVGIAYTLRGIETSGAKAVILGSGGAARAAVFELGALGCKMSISARNADAASALCRDFGIENKNFGIEDADIVVNCTPIGIVEGEYPADITRLHEGQTVFDMVYGRSTPILETARIRGCTYMDGSDMLVGQGAESFRLWFGREPDIDAMKDALR